MSTRVDEALKTPVMHQKVLDAFQTAGITAEGVENPNGEIVGVLARGIMDPAEVLGSVTLHELKNETFDTFEEKEKRRLEIVEIINSVPLAGSNIYPKRFRDVIDLAVQAATGRSGLAAGLNSSTREDNDTNDTRGATFGLHADFVGLGDSYYEGTPLYGLNIHYTRWGSCAVRLGLMRSMHDDRMLYDIKIGITNGTNRPEDLTAAFKATGAPFTEPFELHEGDMLVFQARHHNERGLTPVVHEFTTTSDSRRSDLFIPRLGDTVATLQARTKVESRYPLQDMGYGDYANQAA